MSDGADLSEKDEGTRQGVAHGRVKMSVCNTSVNVMQEVKAGLIRKAECRTNIYVTK
jgi:molybdenum cofactor biosynthesis enzyme